MPKSPVWEYAVGILSAEEYYTNARATHFEIRIGTGHALTVFPHELDDLTNLIETLKARRNRPRLVLDERRQA